MRAFFGIGATAVTYFWLCLSFAGAAAPMSGTPEPGATHANNSSGTPDAQECSKLLRLASGSPISAATHRRCVQVIANSYLEWSVGKAPAERVPLADDVAAYELGQSPTFKAGNRKLILSNPEYHLVEAIRVQSWNVDGNTAWAVYDGSLKSNPGATAFWVIERFTIKDGLIHEIFAACKSSGSSSCSGGS